MKDKKKIAVLVPLVVLVWGYVIYGLINVSSSNKIISSKSIQLDLPENIKITELDYELNLKYQDPFLKQLHQESTLTEESQEKAPPSIQPNKTTTTITKRPNIEFKGTIKNNNTKEQLTILQIDGSEFIFKLGEEYEGVKLLAVYSDSVSVQLLDQEVMFVVK